MFFDASPVCSVDGCDRHVYAKTFCKWHYIRSRKYNGDPVAKAVYPSSKKDFVIKALAAAEAGESDCIIWPFHRKAESRSIDFRNVAAKKLWLEALHNKNSDYLIQTCNNPFCINLRHWVTGKDK